MDAELVVSLLKKDIASLGPDHRLEAALLSRAKYVHYFPQLRLMTKCMEGFSDKRERAGSHCLRKDT